MVEPFSGLIYLSSQRKLLRLCLPPRRR